MSKGLSRSFFLCTSCHYIYVLWEGQLGNGTKNEPLEKKHKKKTTRRPTPSFSNGTAVSYDKIQGNVSEKFQMLINSDMEALQTALL